MKQKICIIALLSLGTTASVYGVWGFGSNNSKAHEEPTITSDREYVVAEKNEEKLSVEEQQVCDEMDERIKQHAELVSSVYRKKTIACGGECKNIDNGCSLAEPKRYASDQSDKLEKALKNDQQRIKGFRNESRASNAARTKYLQEKEKRSRDLKRKIMAIDSYVSKNDQDDNGIVLESARKLAAASIAPAQDSTLGFANYDNAKEALEELFGQTVKYGRLVRFAKIWTEDNELKNLKTILNDASIDERKKAEKLSEVVTSKTSYLFDQCKKLAYSKSGEERNAILTSVEANKGDFDELIAIYEKHTKQAETIEVTQLADEKDINI